MYCELQKNKLKMQGGLLWIINLIKNKACPQCSEINDPDAKFCDNCGHRYT
ncbi:MAG: double zinc ribbon domain-containing protein [Planctomycetota bacterium]